jgi:hypothetical protein
MFLGALGFIDGRLGSTLVSVDAKVEILEALLVAIDFLGADNIASVKHKLLSTLSSASTFVSDHNVLAKIWETFVKTMNTSSIAPIVCQVVANLIRLYEEGGQKVRPTVLDLLSFLLVRNREELREHFKLLFFLPNYKDLEPINASIRKICRVPENADLRDLLGFVLNSMNHDSVEVRTLTLKKLIFVSAKQTCSIIRVLESREITFVLAVPWLSQSTASIDKLERPRRPINHVLRPSAAQGHPRYRSRQRPTCRQMSRNSRGHRSRTP